MPQLRAVLIASAVVSLFGVTAPRAVDGCDCLRLKPLSTDVRREAPVIFSGTVVEIVERNEHTTSTAPASVTSSVRPLERRVVFQVISGWRGVTREVFILSAEISDCMFPFEPGKQYLVFANTDAQGRVSTSICMRTAPLKGADAIIRRLGTPAYRPPSATQTK